MNVAHDKRSAAIIIFLLFAFTVALHSAVVCAENTVATKISKAITAYLLEKDPGLSAKRIEISYKYADRTFRDLKARGGAVTFSVAELYPDFKPLGNIIVPIQVTVDGVQKEKVFLRTKVSVFDRIVVAKMRLKRGDIIGSAEAALEERDIASLNSSIIKDMSIAFGKEAKTFIPQNNPIYDWMIKERSFVRKNERIKITAIAENLTVVADGVSLEDGLLGSSVKVKNLTSGRELVAVVTGTGEVAVK